MKATKGRIIPCEERWFQYEGRPSFGGVISVADFEPDRPPVGLAVGPGRSASRGSSPHPRSAHETKHLRQSRHRHCGVRGDAEQHLCWRRGRPAGRPCLDWLRATGGQGVARGVRHQSSRATRITTPARDRVTAKTWGAVSLVQAPGGEVVLLADHVGARGHGGSGRKVYTGKALRLVGPTRVSSQCFIGSRGG